MDKSTRLAKSNTALQPIGPQMDGSAICSLDLFLCLSPRLMTKTIFIGNHSFVNSKGKEQEDASFTLPLAQEVEVARQGPPLALGRSPQVALEVARQACSPLALAFAQVNPFCGNLRA
jgi:hypothetical protein